MARSTVVLDTWNVLATAKDREQRHLARRLKRFGDFRWTPFRGVLIGRVEQHEAFFEQLQRWEEDQPGFLAPLAKLVPIDQTFTFTTETFLERVKEAVLRYADRIDAGSFYIRIERRGHAREIHSQRAEQELDQMLWNVLQKRGDPPSFSLRIRISSWLSRPSKMSAAWETSRGQCGPVSPSSESHKPYRSIL